MSKDKNLANVLVLPRQVFDKEGSFQGFSENIEVVGTFLQGEIPNCPAYFEQRGIAEMDATTLQILPYIAIVYRNSVLIYSRAKSGGEQRLHGQFSIAVGGHVEDIDHPTEPFEAYLKGAIRELKEEIGLVVDREAFRGTCVGLINDDTNDVGRVHLGVAHVLYVNEHQAQEILKNCEHTMNAPAFVDIADLAANSERLESWSRFFIEKLAEKIQGNGKWNDEGFRERVSLMSIALSNAASSATGFLMQDTQPGHDLSRQVMENCLGAVACIMSGMDRNNDINGDNVNAATEAFMANIGNITKHQNVTKNS